MKFPTEVLNQHLAILGKTGSGKSYCAKGLVEDLLHSKRQVCVLDPTGAWWGLRLNANGKSPGFDVVLLGGKHADIPLAERSGPAVARLITQQGASVVVDTSGFTVGEYTRWFTDFASTLYTTIRNPLHLVIDEAHYFAPQGKAPDPAAGKMIHACNRLMSGGRSLGIKGLLITQRPAKLHKDSLTCADTLIAMRVIAPQDRQAIKDWIDGAGDTSQGKAVLDSLAGLQRGEGWVWYPEGGFLERMKFPAIKTYDSSATPVHGAKGGPKVGEIKLDEVKAALADAVKEAEANDPALLRKQLAEARAQLAKAPAAAPSQAVIDRAVSQAMGKERQEHVKEINAVNAEVRFLQGRITTATDYLNRAIAQLTFEPSGVPTPKPITKPVNHFPATTPKVVNQSGNRNSGSADLGKAERAILQALYWLRGEVANPAKVGFYANYSASSGGFNNALSKLRSSGLVAGWAITDDGAAIAESLGVAPKPRGHELREWLRQKLGKAENAILDALIEHHPQRLTTAQLSQASDYSANSGGFNNALSRLRSIEAADGYERDGGVKASGVFFE